MLKSKILGLGIHKYWRWGLSSSLPFKLTGDGDREFPNQSLKLTGDVKYLNAVAFITVKIYNYIKICNWWLF